jgi:hypothetical protein
MKSSHLSIGKGCMAKDLPLQRKVIPGESEVVGARTPEGWSIRVHQSRLSAKDRCQEILHFGGQPLQRKWGHVDWKLPKPESSNPIMTVE